MSVRASVTEAVQVGLEVTPGTSVAAVKRLLGLSLDANPIIPIEAYRPRGSEAPTAASRQKEYTEATFEGALCYLTLPYLLEAFLGVSGASPYTYKPNPFTAEPIKTLTVEQGSSVAADKFAYGVVSGLRIRCTQEEAAITGSMFGRELQEGVAMTAAPTDVPCVPVDPDSVEVLIGATVAGLAKVDTYLEAEWSLEGRWGPHFTFDPAQKSFKEHKKLAPTLSASLVLEAGSDAAAYMNDLRSKTVNFCRIRATGPEYSLGNNYSFQLTFPFMFQAPSRDDNDDVYAATFPLIPCYDSTFGGFVEIIVNNGATL